MRHQRPPRCPFFVLLALAAGTAFGSIPSHHLSLTLLVLTIYIAWGIYLELNEMEPEAKGDPLPRTVTNCSLEGPSRLRLSSVPDATIETE